MPVRSDDLKWTNKQGESVFFLGYMRLQVAAKKKQPTDSACLYL